ncbi:MAG: hypothetical protein JXR26_04110 [Balneolaceae bacterium]|nr:hypothetical protein [Balneolaceae bacterium]
MLETFYNTFGFFGAILVAFLSFAIFIFWVAGIAGIVYLPESKDKNKKLLFCVIFPPYPFFWIFYDINRERKMMTEND